ncbi:MAG: DUF2283 domain-containing protein [Mucilaginibacter sp.]|uniref:DUF2283 domain-containing protein n=1 Tax=Mucilaginibacter sp. TaxID=1882438 RepID=UPI0034E3F377
MKVTFDQGTDTLYIQFKTETIVESDEDKSGEMIIDYAQNGTIIGIEVLNASAKLSLIKKFDTIEI